MAGVPFVSRPVRRLHRQGRTVGGYGVNLDDAFERSLALLYRAGLDDAHWPAATALVEEAVGTDSTVLVVGEGADDGLRLHFSRLLQRGHRLEELERLYVREYLADDEAVPRLQRLAHGRLVHVPDLYSEDERKTSRVYNEGLPRFGNQNGLYVRFNAPDGLGIVLGVGSPVGDRNWQSTHLRLVKRLLPHIHQSVLLRQMLAAADALGAGLAGLLDNDRIGVVQLDRDGRVLEANGPALDILRRGDGLTDRDGTLDAWLPADRSRLQRLLGRALPDLWGEAPGGGSMTVQRSSSRSRLALHVSPVSPGAADFGGRRVAALVLMVDPASRPRIDAQRVATTLGLTPSEGRMSALLAEGLKVRQIAAATGWRENYVRWMIQQVYRKLGASGQVDLVRQVLATDILPRR